MHTLQCTRNAPAHDAHSAHTTHTQLYTHCTHKIKLSTPKSLRSTHKKPGTKSKHRAPTRSTHSGFVLPHGDFALDPTLTNSQNGSLELHETSLALGEMIADLAPDLIFFSTPHGLALSHDYVVYQNANASGFALIGDDLYDPDYPVYEVPLEAPLDSAVAAELIDYLRDAGDPVDGIQVRVLLTVHPMFGELIVFFFCVYAQEEEDSSQSFGGSEDIQMRWGEVIPMWFYKQFLPSTRSVVFSIPQRRRISAEAMVPELTAIGAGLRPLQYFPVGELPLFPDEM